MDEVLSLELLVVVFVPVSSDGQDGGGSTLNGDDVGKRDFFFIPRQIHVYVDLQYLIPIIIGKGIPLLFCLFLLNVGEEPDRLTQFCVFVEACYLQLLEFVLRLTHDMGDTLGGVNIACPIGHDQVFSRNKRR